MGLHPTEPCIASTVIEQTPTPGKVPLWETFTVMMETEGNSRHLRLGVQGSWVQGVQLWEPAAKQAAA